MAIIKADLDDMVFEDRNKSYGAFPLRKKYPRHLTYATVGTMLAFLLIAWGPDIMAAIFGKEDKEVGKKVVVKMSMEDLPPPPPMEDEPPPPPPELPPPPQLKTVAFKIPEPTPEEELDPEEEQTIAEVEELKEAPNIGIEDVEGEDEGFFDGEIEGEGEVPEVIVEKEPDINQFIFAEEEPRPVNMDVVRKAIGYPQIARDAGIEGSVVIRVLVDAKGRYKRHKVLNGVHPILSKAVENNISKLQFTPAIQGGKPIQFWVNIPFNFKLLN